MNDLLIVLHVIISVLITINVLLTRSDVRPAIGWIGLVWFSPFIGAFIYYVFGINRVARRALKLKRGLEFQGRSTESHTFDQSHLEPNIRQIAKTGDALGGFEILNGNRLSIYSNGDAAYPEMLSAIGQAKHSIALCMYIFREDRVGKQFVEALAQARQRGVDIRVLVDGIGSGYFHSPIARRLKQMGINVHRFMHDWRPWNMSIINLRNHKKLVIIDGETGFIGGLNIGGENILSPNRTRAVNDTHFRVNGPIVHQLMSSFADDWMFTTHERLSDAKWWPKISDCGSMIARVTNSGPDEDLGTIETILSVAISQAESHIRIVTPYFLPDNHMKATLSFALLRGVKVELIVPGRSDFVHMDWAMREHLVELVELGLNCKLSPRPFEHSKLVSVDGKWCAIGSPNWDVRSMRLNFEILLECYDLETIGAIDTIIDEKSNNAHDLDSRELLNRNLIIRIRDSFARLFLPYL